MSEPTMTRDELLGKEWDWRNVGTSSSPDWDIVTIGDFLKENGLAAVPIEPTEAILAPIYDGGIDDIEVRQVYAEILENAAEG